MVGGTALSKNSDGSISESIVEEAALDWLAERVSYLRRHSEVLL
jgi:hypothetical protein